MIPRIRKTKTAAEYCPPNMTSIPPFPQSLYSKYERGERALPLEFAVRLSALYGVTHGAGLAVVFPAWQTFMTRHNLRKVAQMAHNVWRVTPTGNDLADALEGIRLFKDFLHRIGMPVTFAELGVPAPDIDALVENLHLHKGNPIGSYFPLTPADTKAIYTLALGDGG